MLFRECSPDSIISGLQFSRQFFKTESLSMLFRECSPDSIISGLQFSRQFFKDRVSEYVVP